MNIVKVKVFYHFIKEDLYDDSSADNEALLEAEKRKR